VLVWAAVLPDRPLDAPAAHRYLRWTSVAAVAGVLHPAVALGARDLIGQLAAELPDDPALRHRHATATAASNVLALASAVPALALLALALSASGS
jgi:hypothetical protein